MLTIHTENIMHLSNILDVMNIGWSKLVRKEFTKSGFLKEGYITHQNYLPLWYELSKTKAKTIKKSYSLIIKQLMI